MLCIAKHPVSNTSCRSRTTEIESISLFFQLNDERSDYELYILGKERVAAAFV